MEIGRVSNKVIYHVIQEEWEEKHYPIKELCKIGNVSRAAFYKWLRRNPTKNELQNSELSKKIEEIYEADTSKGYRRINDDLKRDYNENVNDKRILRICRTLHIKSVIKYKNNGCTKQAKDPYHIAKNLLHREFKAEKPNEKWLTDVTEFKYYTGQEKHKIYLSAILDLYDRRIVAYEISDSNNNDLVFNTFDKAVKENPEAQPLFHSDRGFQYTSKDFYKRLKKANMRQSMSRVGKCIDNGPMEGFWGILKRERYYKKRYTSKSELISMIEDYIFYYNNKRYQRNLGVITPMEKYALYQKVA